jgi:hypothetical protein
MVNVTDPLPFAEQVPEKIPLLDIETPLGNAPLVITTV